MCFTLKGTFKGKWDVLERMLQVIRLSVVYIFI